MKGKVKGDELNAVVLEGYLEFLITGVINVRYPSHATVQQMIPFAFGCITLYLAIVYMPLALFYVWTRSSKLFKDHAFERSWASFYEGIRIINKWPLLFNFFFMLRRIILVYIIFWM